MIINLLLNTIVLFLGALFSLFPEVNTLPSIVGFDVDAALVSGVGQAHSLFIVFWPFSIMLQGTLFLLTYYSIKLIARFFLGHRSIQ